jgi:hypothetical protein
MLVLLAIVIFFVCRNWFLKNSHDYGIVVFVARNENCALVDEAVKESHIYAKKSFDEFNRVNRYDLDERSGSFSIFIATLRDLFSKKGIALNYYKDDSMVKGRTIFVIYDEG